MESKEEIDAHERAVQAVASALVQLEVAAQHDTGTLDAATARMIRAGFMLRDLRMRNGDTGVEVWRSRGLQQSSSAGSSGGSSAGGGGGGSRGAVQEAHLPASLLAASCVWREVTFSHGSSEQGAPRPPPLPCLCMRQRLWLVPPDAAIAAPAAPDPHGLAQLLEEWHFKFGFIIPCTTNTHESVVVSANYDSDEDDEAEAGAEAEGAAGRRQQRDTAGEAKEEQAAAAAADGKEQEDAMLPREVLSGNLLVETLFYDEQLALHVAHAVVRVWYGGSPFERQQHQKQ